MDLRDRLVLLIGLLALWGCEGPGDGPGGSGVWPPPGGADHAGDATLAADTGADVGPAEPDLPPPDPRAEMCARWTGDRATLTEGSWDGSVEGCDAGTVSADGLASAVKLVNLYRALAKLPPVTDAPELNALAQACALMMHANGTLSHSPPTTWKCYTAPGAQGASQSNIATGPGVMAVDLYMLDTYNEDTLGHRRWILSNSLGPIGVGSTDGYSCLYVRGSSAAAQEWTAFPPPGPFPAAAIAQPWMGSITDTGWSIQSDTIDLSGAEVRVRAGDAELPVEVFVLPPGYGSSFAIRIAPQGWEMAVGQTYRVEVTGVAAAIAYDVEVVDCAAR